MTPLDEDARSAALAELPAWQLAGDGAAIRRSLRFADFSAAWAFMTRVALAAEAADHHPDWHNSWNRVDISLSTHEAGGLTARDVTLARRIDRLAADAAAIALPPR